MNIEKLKAAAIAANQAWMDEPYEIEPALVLELIERLEAAEKQRDELVEVLKYCRQKIAYMTEHGEWYSPGRAIEMADTAIASVKEKIK